MLSETKDSHPSKFVWYELHTPDPSAATSFYQSVLGWQVQDAGAPGRSYSLLSVGKTPVAGMLGKPAQAFTNGSKPGWMGYIGVDDVLSAAKSVEQGGGVIHRAAEDMPGVGRFAVVADPQGAVFVLFEPPKGVTPPEPPEPGAQGTAAWHDLAALDWQSDFAFYSDLFGWRKDQAIDMGAYGIYQIFAAGAEPLGGMMTRMDPSQPPGWLFYFHVDQIDGAIARVKQQGGRFGITTPKK